MKTVAQLIGGLALSAAAFVHAASEVDPLGLGIATNTKTSLSAHAMTEFIGHASRAEFGPQAAEEWSEAKPLPPAILSLARRAFVVDPFHASTIRVIALGSIIQEDTDQARQAMRAAWRVSKRDDLATMWLAQDYGQLGDLPKMIAFLDSSLRTSRRVRDAAMKPLVNLLAYDDAREVIGDLLVSAPEWEPQFWQEFTQNPVALQNAAQFFAVSSLSPQRIRPDDRGRLYANLKEAEQIEALYRLATADPDIQSDPHALADGRFTSGDALDPLDWTLHSEGNFATRVSRKSGELEVDARPESFGTTAERIVRLSGRQQLRIALAGALPEGAYVELIATCAVAPKASLARISLVPGVEEASTEFEAGECAYGNLALKFRMGPTRGGSVLRIASISMMPAA